MIVWWFTFIHISSLYGVVDCIAHVFEGPQLRNGDHDHADFAFEDILVLSLQVAPTFKEKHFG